MKKALVVLSLFFSGLGVQAQLSPAFTRLQRYLIDTAKWGNAGSTQHPLYTAEGLNYLQPLYQYAPVSTFSIYNQQLVQALAFAGDHQAALHFNRLSYDSMPAAGYKDVRDFLDTISKFSLVDARSFILNRAANERVVMFNENPRYLQQRAFFYSLLDDFYQLGFRYLSLHWLNPSINPNQAPVSRYLGYQVADPIAAELVRKAKQLGFTLITQGDTSITKRTANVQDAVQASKLNSLLQQDTTARLLVLDESAHISEKAIGDFTPMATVLRRLSGIDPLTIDQTELCEASSFEYGRYFFEEFNRRVPVQQVSVAVRNQQPVSLLENDQVDLQLVFPKMVAEHNRANWLGTAGKRVASGIQPAHRELFFVQAYQADEANKYAYANIIPVDQTYLTDRDGYYWLYLPVGKYKLVYRDINYQILSERNHLVE